jgi:hypothetical protein
MRFLALALAAAAACGSCSPALAACRWEWLCNGEGACKQMPACDSVHESPPESPPLAMRPAGAANAGGGLACEHVMRLARGGRWSWSVACYCTDRSRNPDASRPFANIVRCDERSGMPAAVPAGDLVVEGRAGRSFPLRREDLRGLP